MHEKTTVFLDAVKASKCMNDDAAEVVAEALLDEIEEAVAESMGLRRLYRQVARAEDDPELVGRLGEYESKLGALDRDAEKLLKALETFRTTVSHMKRADRRLQEWIEERPARAARAAEEEEARAAEETRAAFIEARAIEVEERAKEVEARAIEVEARAAEIETELPDG